ncbi:MAG: TerD family protein, partial [Streptomyces sp.]|nr:TerD family protein [Streptomyces sp.]
MTKGSNAALSALSENTGSVIVSLGWSSPAGDGDADVSVLLLGPNGKVRSDADFYFYNNPVAADGSVHLLDKTPTEDGNEDRISFDLTVVPPEVDRVVVAASRYGDAHFGELDDLRVTLSDAVGENLLRFAIGDPDKVSAIIFGELYRREGEWKFRAVGQGYASGLAGLATDFGVDIDDEAETPDENESETTHEDADGTAPAATPEPTGNGEPAGPPSDAAPAPDPAETLNAVPAPRRATDEARTRRPAARPRTAKKRAAPPSAPQKSLGENDSWRPARLFPLSALKSDRDREMRATSVLLSVMTQVPRFGRRLTAAFGAPSGRMETFTEVSLPHGDTPRRPDGVIRIERAGKLWTALVETKTNGNALKADQVQAYMDIAARRGYEAVITLSNDVALEGTP